MQRWAIQPEPQAHAPPQHPPADEGRAAAERGAFEALPLDATMEIRRRTLASPQLGQAGSGLCTATRRSNRDPHPRHSYS